MLEQITKKAKTWLAGNYDERTKEQVKYLLENDEAELIDSFYQDLEFGTGGLRGVMGVGTNRMNKYTVGMATQGLANYLKKTFDSQVIKVAIGYDCRNNSKFFAQVTAEVLSANGITVYIFDELRPLPEISFTVRHLNCQSGIMITASHNPKEYNGYKVFWDDGGQIVTPHDKNIIDEVKKIKNIDDVKFAGDDKNIEIVGAEIDKEYLKRIKSMSLSPDLIKKHSALKIVYTPLHGCGVKLVPQALEDAGFTNIYHVPEQDVIDGNFSTVKYPNPEEIEALNMALDKAKEVNADFVLATDPDADRMAMAIKNSNNEFVVLNGNQSASLFVYYLITQWKEKGKLTGNEYIVKTIVTSELLKAIANKNDVECFDVLTGFKWIADVIKQNEHKKTFIGGGEESIGFMIGDFVRDKDAVTSCATIAETAAWAAENGKSLFDLLIDIYLEFGMYRERLMYIVKKGVTGAEEIKKMMKNYRNNPMESINNSKVVRILDYDILKEKDLIAGTEKDIHLPKSNVLQFYLEDGSKISVRPSGTEPKIKYYFEVNQELKDKKQFVEVENLLNQKIDDIIASMGLS